MNKSDTYREPDGSLNYLLELKLDHSNRVADDSTLIATELGWSQDDINIATAIGILHDVGRFSQFKEFNTFFDGKSVNHGKRGYEVAQTCSVLDECDNNTHQAILDSIHFHNCRDLPTGLNEDSYRFLNLIRDADKIDIVYIVNHAITNNLHEKYPQIMLDINLDGPVTPELLKEIQETGTGSYKHVNSLADMNLMRLTWISNINYAPSLKIFSDRKLMEGLIESIPSSPE
ncbi:hypothetical protein BVX97_03970, partial [bacterium E08(2017)]